MGKRRRDGRRVPNPPPLVSRRPTYRPDPWTPSRRAARRLATIVVLSGLFARDEPFLRRSAPGLLAALGRRPSVARGLAWLAR